MKRQIEGLDELLGTLEKLGTLHRQKELDDALAQGGLVAIREAKRLAPVDTGDLKANLHVGGYTGLTPDYRAVGAYGALKGPIGQGRSRGVLVGTKLPYAHFPEMGTKRGVKARRFLIRAVDGKQVQILAAIDKGVQKLIDEG